MLAQALQIDLTPVDAWIGVEDPNDFRDGAECILALLAGTLHVVHLVRRVMCRHVVGREAFGSPLAEEQTVQNWIADSRAEMEAARLLTL